MLYKEDIIMNVNELIKTDTDEDVKDEDLILDPENIDTSLLLPCPFCGSTEIYYYHNYCDKECAIICSECGARSAPCVYGKKKEPIFGRKFMGAGDAVTYAVRSWNRRILNQI